MAYSPFAPYNDLPLLPPGVDIETKAVLKHAMSASRALADWDSFGRKGGTRTDLQKRSAPEGLDLMICRFFSVLSTHLHDMSIALTFLGQRLGHLLVHDRTELLGRALRYGANYEAVVSEEFRAKWREEIGRMWVLAKGKIENVRLTQLPRK